MRREGLVARVRRGNRAIYHVKDPKIKRVCAIVCGELSERLSDDLEALAGEGI
jgi:hypothetical protein